MEYKAVFEMEGYSTTKARALFLRLMPLRFNALCIAAAEQLKRFALSEQ